ncbi:tetraacyldisaccharide 4'-kinase, partial [bacterium]|nr:tetraacyldisaccharide 4'-kinase [bacterium]
KTDLDKLTTRPEKDFQIILIDTIGELFSLYSIADLVFVGGSLVSVGGHNILEPAYFSKPIIFGPHMFNFKEMSELFLKNNAAVQIQNQLHLKQTISELLQNPEKANTLGQNAKTILTQNAGAAEKSFEIIKKQELGDERQELGDRS